MNTTERIVESYFRLCRGCFTYPDVKVQGGNNRQLDLLAYHLRDDTQFHIETSVTHEKSWWATWEKLSDHFDRKFFGAPRQREGENTDHTKGKNYNSRIREAYSSVGFDERKVHRIWITWVVPQGDEFEDQLSEYCRQKKIRQGPIQVISFRDEVLPKLMATVGKSNYDDDVLRTFSLLRQYERQVRMNSAAQSQVSLFQE